MKKFLSLLKYLDQSKVTPEAVLEIASCLGRAPTMEQAAEVAKAFRTRGIAGLVTKVTEMASWPQIEDANPQEPVVVICRKCGAIMEIENG